MEPITRASLIRLSASLFSFVISSLFTAYLAWSETQPTHTLLDNFSGGFGHVKFGWVQPTILIGLGFYFLYLAIELPSPKNRILSVIFRKFKKSIFLRFLPFSLFFSLFAGLLFGPGMFYLIYGDEPRANLYIAGGLYCLLASLLFVWLPSLAANLVKSLNKRELLEAIVRSFLLMAGFLSIIGAFMG